MVSVHAILFFKVVEEPEKTRFQRVWEHLSKLRQEPSRRHLLSTTFEKIQYQRLPERCPNLQTNKLDRLQLDVLEV